MLSFVMTSSTPCRRSRQLIEPYLAISLKLFRFLAAKNLPMSRPQVELIGTEKSTVPSFIITSSTPCRRSRQLIEPYGTISLKLFRSRAANNLPLSRPYVEHNGTKQSTVSSCVMTSSTPCRRSRQLIEPY